MLNSPVLVVMAAGMGSRYGGLKQIDKMDEYGNTLIDFSLYDARKAGFRDVLFIIRHDIEEDFMNVMGERLSAFDNVEFVYQDLDNLPRGISIPDGRKKPYGTTHALYCCCEKLDGKSFVTINADDFYGFGAYKLAYEFLTNETDDNIYAIMGYDIASTCSNVGYVSRGVCVTDENSFLTRIDERKKIKPIENKICYTLDEGKTFEPIPDGAVSSMNMWAFNPGFERCVSRDFEKRLKEGLESNPLTFEETITDAVQIIMNDNACTVKVIPTGETWFGVTYAEDKPLVKASIDALRAEGKYPEKLY